MCDISLLATLKEDNKLEVKKATGGLPNSLWETYSSFANSDGGTIVLGASENNDRTLQFLKLDNPDKLVKDFWDSINNPKKVNINILKDQDVKVHVGEDYAIITICVPRAERYVRPIYINNNIMSGSFRRNFEGDYHCTPNEIKNMLRDQSDIHADSKMLQDMSIDNLNEETIIGYRNRFSSLKPSHSFNKLDNNDFLQRIGAAAFCNHDKRVYPTVAGLLMFGQEYEIIRVFPNFFLDYQEHMDKDIRWNDRIISSSGDWSGNINDFYFKIYSKLTQDLQTPFFIEQSSSIRIDETPIHEALREALVNTLVNANYYERLGIVIKKYPNSISFENPGDFRLPKEKILLGGTSDPRNAILLKMFNLIGIGERAGSGIPNIYDIWDENEWEKPSLTESFGPDRIHFNLKFTKVIDKKVPIKSADKKVPIKSADKKVPIKSADKETAVPSLKPNYSKKTRQNMQAILQFMKPDEQYSSKDIMVALNVKETRAKQILRILVDEGNITTIGDRKTRKYIVINSN